MKLWNTIKQTVENEECPDNMSIIIWTASAVPKNFFQTSIIWDSEFYFLDPIYHLLRGLRMTYCNIIVTVRCHYGVDYKIYVNIC